MNTAPITSKKILLIEDDASLREFLSKSLTEKGFFVTTAVDGEEGLTKMLSDHPDATIIDVLLPKKNGFTLINEFREKEPDSTMKIIVLTELSDMQYAATAIEKKALAYIVKSDHSLEGVANLIEQQLITPATVA